ncbi:MAG: LysM peptidoglycan-binding domain-containing protein, partial [Calditrichaeota bacterium]
MSGEMEVLASIQPHVDALVAEYRAGNFTAAGEEVATIFRALETLSLHSHPQKIAFLEYYFPQPHASPQLGTIITEVLAQTESPFASTTGEGPSPPAYAWGGRGTARDYLPTPSPAEFRGDLQDFIRQEIRQIAEHMGEGDDFHLHRDFLREIEYYIELFRTDAHYRPLIQKAIRRSRKYIPALRRYFVEKGFPEEIMYLGLIESGFNPVARSHSGAVGMFQFIKSTARKYGLRVNRSVDERYSPIKSARACRSYLHDLWMELGSFTLALSAYNSGAGKIRQALRRLNNPDRRDFWTIREKTRVLREETRNFVPKIFAAIVIAKPGNARKFGFYDPPFPDPRAYRTVIVPYPVSLKPLAKAAGISLRDILRLNPDLEPKDTATPRGVLDYPLFVPKGTEQKIAAAVKRLARRPPKTSRVAASGGSRASGNTVTIAYRVQRGNTLSHIAAWFGKRIARLKQWNPYLRRRPLRAGDVVYVRELPSGWAKITHTVQQGETLSDIAGRYQVLVRALKAWNGLRGETLIPGTRLTIYTRHPRGV